VYRKGAKGNGPLLSPYHAVLGVAGARNVSFPLDVFEPAILSRLREIDPREVLPGGDATAGRVLAATGRLADVEARIEKVQAQALDGGDVPAALADILRRLETRRDAAAAELAEARREAASPLSAAWGECQSLVDALATAPDLNDARTRLRAALRRMVTVIPCLFVAKGLWRLAAVQVWFRGDGSRSYLIIHRPATAGAVGNRPAQTRVYDFAEADVGDDLDLRKPAHARRLERALSSLDPADLLAGAE
jgi:hypothetical protein